jgi:DNA-binding transcriptional ArsR family regulator
VKHRSPAHVFEALSSEARLKIISMVCKSTRPLHIQGIAKQLEMNYASVYRHIEVLEDLGLVEIYEVGRSRVLSVPRADQIQALIDMASKFLKKE